MCAVSPRVGRLDRHRSEGNVGVGQAEEPRVHPVPFAGQLPLDRRAQLHALGRPRESKPRVGRTRSGCCALTSSPDGPAAGHRGRRKKRRWRTSRTPSASTLPRARTCSGVPRSAKGKSRAERCRRSRASTIWTRCGHLRRWALESCDRGSGARNACRASNLASTFCLRSTHRTPEISLYPPPSLRHPNEQISLAATGPLRAAPASRTGRRLPSTGSAATPTAAPPRRLPGVARSLRRSVASTAR